MAWSSRLGVRTKGKHQYYAFRQPQDENIEALANIMISTGVPLYGQGSFVVVQAADFLESKERFGLEILLGLSAKPGLSNANKNAFTIDGQLHKLGSLDMVEGFEKGQTSEIKKAHFVSRTESNVKATCDFWFTMQFKMEANVPAVAVKVHEMYE